MDKFRSSGALQLITVFVSLISITTIVITNSIYEREIRRVDAQVVDVSSVPTTHYPLLITDSPTPSLTLTTTLTPTPTARPLPTTHKPQPTTGSTSPVANSPTPKSPPLTLTLTSTPIPTSAPTGNYQTVYVTYYGWPDNDPPGPAIAYPVRHSSAGGTGTYDDPITFASDGTFSVGQILYVPYIKKYVIKEDLCATCSGNHIDIWMESDASYESQLIQCQRHWTRSSTQIEINPPNNRTVEYTPLFNKSNGQCLN